MSDALDVRVRVAGDWPHAALSFFYSPFISGAQRLPNGNTLICSGVKGRLFEVTRDGEIVWEYMSPYFRTRAFGETSLVFRAYRLPYSWLP